ncbi:4758_t:CDS:2, partial [Diversispora eburnea]
IYNMTIIAFISQKGGVGKSTLARAVAVEASKQKLNVLLADCDPQQATIEVFPTVQQGLRETNKYDLTIIDGPARTSHATLEIAQKADLVIQPTGASRDDLIPAVKEFNALVKAGVNKKKLIFALTRLSTPKEAEAIKDYLKDTGYKYSETYLYEKTSYKQTQNEGRSITETKYKKLAKQAKDLKNRHMPKEILRCRCRPGYKCSAPLHGKVPQEVSENIQKPEFASRDNRFTGRTKQLGLRVKPEFTKKLKTIAVEEDCLLIEVLEKALDSLKESNNTVLEPFAGANNLIKMLQDEGYNFDFAAYDINPGSSE